MAEGVLSGDPPDDDEDLRECMLTVLLEPGDDWTRVSLLRLVPRDYSEDNSLVAVHSQRLRETTCTAPHLAVSSVRLLLLIDCDCEPPLAHDSISELNHNLALWKQLPKSHSPKVA